MPHGSDFDFDSDGMEDWANRSTQGASGTAKRAKRAGRRQKPAKPGQKEHEEEQFGQSAEVRRQQRIERERSKYNRRKLEFMDQKEESDHEEPMAGREKQADKRNLSLFDAIESLADTNLPSVSVKDMLSKFEDTDVNKTANKQHNNFETQITKHIIRTTNH